MSVAITAVPVAASDVQAAPAGVNDAQAGPAGQPQLERPLADFVTPAQGNPLGDAGHLANPAALVSELVGSLRGYLASARSLDLATRFNTDNAPAGPDTAIASRTPAAADEMPLHGGPARQRLDAGDGAALASAGVGLAQLRRTMDVALQSLNFTTQTTLVVHGTGQVSRSTNTLLKGQ